MAFAVIQLQEDDLLPGAQNQPSRSKGHNQARSNERGPDMRMAVAIVPAQIMGIIDILWRNPLQGIPQVRHQTVLILDGGHRSRSPGNEDHNRSRLQRGPLQALLHLICYIHYLALIGLNLENISISCSTTVLS